MTRTVNVEVYCEMENGEKDIFAVVSDHRPDLPRPFDEQLQSWAQSEYSHLQPSESLTQAAEMVYEPDGYVVRFREY